MGFPPRQTLARIGEDCAPLQQQPEKPWMSGGLCFLATRDYSSKIEERGVFVSPALSRSMGKDGAPARRIFRIVGRGRRLKRNRSRPVRVAGRDRIKA